MTIIFWTDQFPPADEHAYRPNAADVPEGTLFSCLTHELIYQSDGTTWTTWADLTT